MNIAKIIAITPDGKPWTNEHGTLYPFMVAFDDHHSGQVNAKSNPPAYKVGDVCGYDVTGKSPRGIDKFKITRNPKPGEGTVTSPPPIDSSNPDLEAQTSPQSSGTRITFVPPHPAKTAPTSQGTPVNGQTVGMAVKAAVDIWIASGRGPEGFDLNEEQGVEAIARRIVAISERIQSGPAPRPSKDYSVTHAAQETLDEDVPF